jgi:hypothetical protein
LLIVMWTVISQDESSESVACIMQMMLWAVACNFVVLVPPDNDY